MGEITVKFLGKNYILPEELKEYVAYCKEFEKINDRLSKALLVTMKKPSLVEGANSSAQDIESTLKEKMRSEARQIISMLAKHSIYDVTESDLVDGNKGYVYYDEVYKKMMKALSKNLADKIQGFLDNYDYAQQSAYSQVTGTGISMYSNSIIAHMTLAAFETSTVKKQCDKADRDFERVLDTLSAKNNSEFDRKNTEVMMKTFSEVAEAFGMFTSELMETYLQRLQEKCIFDYSKVKPYNIKRSSELLNNLSMIEDKKSVLEQAFKNCPYNPDIYAKVLELGLCDIDTFVTAKEFYQDSVLKGLIESYCKKNLNEYDTMILK